MNSPIVTFTAGCGGSGKSRVLASQYPGIPVIDCDKIKLTLPGYDPKNPGTVHEASSLLALRAFYSALGTGSDFAFDGSGKNVEKYVSLIAAAKGAGFRTRILFVNAPLSVCLQRNAARARTVSSTEIIDAHAAVNVAQTVLRHCVDEYVEISNA